MTKIAPLILHVVNIEILAPHTLYGVKVMIVFVNLIRNGMPNHIC